MVESVGAHSVDFFRVCELALAAVAPIAVQNDADMSRHRPGPDLPRKPAFVDSIERRQHVRPRFLLLSHLMSNCSAGCSHASYFLLFLLNSPPLSSPNTTPPSGP